MLYNISTICNEDQRALIHLDADMKMISNNLLPASKYRYVKKSSYLEVRLNKIIQK